MVETKLKLTGNQKAFEWVMNQSYVWMRANYGIKPNWLIMNRSDAYDLMYQYRSEGRHGTPRFRLWSP